MNQMEDAPPARLLIVDDRPENLMALEAVLQPLGHEIHRASSGDEALRLCLTTEFAVILLDVQMPGTDGLTTAQLLKERKASSVTPIIFLTASYNGPRDQFSGYAAGAVDYIAKPFDPEVVRAKVAVFVELFQARERNRREHAALIAEQVARTTAERVRERLEHLLEGMTDAFIGFDPAHRIIYVNQRAEKLLGAPRHALMGMRVMKAIEGIGPDVVVGRLPEILDAGSTTCVELSLPSQRRTFEATVYTSRCERSLFLRDVSEQRNAEASLRRAEEQLQAAHRMEAVGQFAGSIAHDFNNILTIIGSYADFLIEDVKAKGMSLDDLQEIRMAADRGGALVRQLMAYSRTPGSTSRSDVPQVIAAFEPLLRRLVGASVALSFRFDDEVPEVGLAPTLIEQILLNLAANARDAMPSGGTLSIEGVRAMREWEPGRARPCALIAVTDTGTGMDDETMERMFDAFFTTKEQGKGTGLGLATVNGIVEQAGGIVEVDSSVGRGTTFRIYLPAIDAEDGDLRVRVGTEAAQRRSSGLLRLENRHLPGESRAEAS